MMINGQNVRAFCRRAYRWAHSAFFYEHWMVGVVDAPIEQSPGWTELPPVRWIEPYDRHRYLASAFPWPGSGDTLLCENVRTEDAHAELIAAKLDANGIAVEIGLKFPIEGALSFPFLFMRDSIVYAMPTATQARRLEIFRWHEHDGTWVSHAVVFDDKAVANAILFEKDGWFWIAYSDLDDGVGENLHLIYSSRLAGPWRHHGANPVQTGRRASRNAGPVFQVGDKLYRPAQDWTQGKGSAVRLMEIKTCTPLSYEEIEATHIDPAERLYPDGFRSLVAWGDKCLVDGMRLSFAPRLVFQLLKQKVSWVFQKQTENRRLSRDGWGG